MLLEVDDLTPHQLRSQWNQVREAYIRVMENADESDLTNLNQFLEEYLKEGH